MKLFKFSAQIVQNVLFAGGTCATVICVNHRSSMLVSIRDLIASYSHITALKQSELLYCEAVQRTVPTGVHASIDDRAATLRGLVRWCIETLAPSPPMYPPGTCRPLLDPTWNDPAWWHYNILRYRIIETIPPDEYFEGSGPVTTLIARLGLSSRSAYYTCKKHAMKNLETALQNVLTLSGNHHDVQDSDSWSDIRRDLLGDRVGCLRQWTNRIPWKILGIASVFYRAFPREILWKSALEEGHVQWTDALDILVKQRCIIELNHGRELVVPSRIRDYVYQYQTPERLARRHHLAAEFCRRDDRLPDRILHLQHSGNQTMACDLMEQHWSTLNTQCNVSEFTKLLEGFRPGDIGGDRWLSVLVLKGSYMIRLGRLEEARAVFSRHVHESDNPESRMLALLYLAHVCSRIDPKAAQRYYDSALNRIDRHPSYMEFLFSSLGRFHLNRGELEPAEQYLKRAMIAEPHPKLSFRSVLLFALAELYLKKQSFEKTARYSRELLDYAEVQGDAHLIAQAIGLQGRIALAEGNHAAALRDLEQAEQMHRSRGNINEVSRMLGDRAAIHAETGDMETAVQLYREALVCGMQTGNLSDRLLHLHLALIRLLITLHRWDAAGHQWVLTRCLGQQSGQEAGFFQELNDLSRKIYWGTTEKPPVEMADLMDIPSVRKVMDSVRRTGSIDSRSVRNSTGLGRTAAYLLLDRLVQAGLLQRSGRGRATRYFSTIFSTDPGTHLPGTAPHRDHPDTVAILNYVREVGYITSHIARQIVKKSPATVKRRLAKLVQTGRLEHTGKGRATRYSVPC